MYYILLIILYDASYKFYKLLFAFICSAGVGRTGTFIMVDMLLDQAKAEGEVDVFGNLKRIREQRTNLVQATVSKLFISKKLKSKLLILRITY